MVFWAIEGLRRMTTGANSIAWCFKFKTVRFVAVAASHTALMHLALNKRAIDIDLALNLPVCMVQVLPESLGPIMVKKL